MELSRYRIATWVIIGLWFIAGAATLNYNGPFFDEGIYLSAALRVVEGKGLDDGYLRWFAGSLLWPTIASPGVRFGGLIGARIISLCFAAGAFAAFAASTSNLFGHKSALWATLALAFNAPLFGLARMGVYDALALCALAASLYAITELGRRDHRGWVVAAALAYTVAVFAKYPVALMLLPLLGVLIVLRGRKAATDIVLFGFDAAALVLAFYLPVRHQVAGFIAYRLTNSPATGVSMGMIAVDLARLSTIPLLLALGGWLVARGRRALATVLLLALAMWPTYHLVLGDPVSSNKHVVYGFLFAYPLAGLALHRLWRWGGSRSWVGRTATLALLAFAATVGVTQSRRMDRAWPDARPAAAFLVARVQRGDRLLINESWPYTMYLYRAARITSPWDVFDVYRITHGESEIDLCEYDWFVDVQGAYRWPEEIAAAVRQCGRFQPVFSTTSTVVSMGQDLNYVRYPVSTTVWQHREEE